MRKSKLIILGICLFFGGIRLEILKSAALKRFERRMKKGKPLSDFVSVKLEKKIEAMTAAWKKTEQKYSKMYNENTACI